MAEPNDPAAPSPQADPDEPPKQGVHFHDRDSEVGFQGVRFKLQGVSFVYGRPWTEKEDIGIERPWS